MKEEIAKHRFIIFIILIFFFGQILIFSRDVGWDDSVYIGMGKYIYSFGKIGLWEEIRPPIFPLIVGFFWSLGFSIILYKIIALLFSISLLVISYKILLNIDKRTALLTAFMIAFTPIYFFNSTRVLTDIPSTFFSLLAIFLFLKRSYFISGIITSIAILTRFPQGIVAISIISFLMYKKEITNLKRYLLGLLPLLFVYLALNKIVYGSLFYSLIKANQAITKSAPWLYEGGVFFYISSLLKENALFIFLFPAIYFIFRNKDFKDESERIKFLIFITGFIFLIYFSLIEHKETRYAISFIPYLAAISSYGINRISKLCKLKFKYLVILIAFIFFISTFDDYESYKNKKIEDTSLREFVVANELHGVILTSNPTIAAYSDTKIIPYYSSFDKSIRIYEENIKEASFIIYDSSAFVCNDAECIKSKMDLYERIASENKLIYRKGTLYIFSRP